LVRRPRIGDARDVHPEATALLADGALFIGRIKSFTIEGKVIMPRSDWP
jgi:hypothetical protein